MAKRFKTRKELETFGRKIGLSGLRDLDYQELVAVVNYAYSNKKKKGLL